MEYEEVEVNSERWFCLDDLLNEEWKDIQGYEGAYQVSNYGRIKSLYRIKKQWNGFLYSERSYRERIKKINILKGYAYVGICKNCKQKTTLAHRLVAQEFIPNPLNKPQVNHKDGNKLNCSINNLEWNTSSENINHAYKNNLIKPRYGKDNPKSVRIIKIDIDTNKRKHYNSLSDAGRDLNMTVSHVFYLLKYKRIDKKTNCKFIYNKRRKK